MPNWFRKHHSNPARVSSDTSPNGVYSKLRDQALATNRSEAGLSAPSPGAPVWGVVMETGHEEVTVTLFALTDGTTSLYLSNGGGVIGGHDHEAVRKVSAGFIDQANHSLLHLKPCDLFPVPKAAHTIFYALTDSGILTGGGLENDLGYGRLPLSALFHAGQEVITQLRLIADPKPSDQCELLITAVLEGKVNKVHQLLEEGADADCTDDSGTSALIFAVIRNEDEIVRVLLSSGANPNAIYHNPEQGYSQAPAMMFPAVNGNVDILKSLLAAGANIEGRDASRRSEVRDR